MKINVDYNKNYMKKLHVNHYYSKRMWTVSACGWCIYLNFTDWFGNGVDCHGKYPKLENYIYNGN
jgi:hypothetical protein